MSYRFRSDESPKINIELNIQITFPMTPLTNNDEYFSEKREESSLILNVLKEMGATDYKLRYCLVIDGEFGEYTYNRDRQTSRFLLVPGPPQWNEFGQFIVQISAQISQDISDNTNAVVITSAFLSIIASLVQIISIIPNLGKKKLTIIEDGRQIKLEFEHFGKKEREDLTERVVQSLKEKPDVSINRKVKIDTKPVESRQYRRRRKRKGKR